MIKYCVSFLRNLGKRDDLYISKPDKGNGVVILNRSDYVSKMSEILSDNTKFIPVNDDCYKLSQVLETRLNKVLLTFFKSNKIDKLTIICELLDRIHSNCIVSQKHTKTVYLSAQFYQQ